MKNLVLSFNIIAPLLIYMLIGAFLAKIGLVTDDFRQKMNKLLVKLIIPCNICRNLYVSDLSNMLDAVYVPYAVLSNMAFFFAFYFISKRFIKDPARLGSFVQGTTRGNAVIFGIPLCESVFGVGTPEMALTLAVLVPYYNTFEIVMIEACGQKAEAIRNGVEPGKTKINWKRLGKKLVTNGILWGVFMGLLINFSRLPVPEFADTVINKIGGCVSPLSFMMAGSAFSFKAAKKDSRLLAVATVFKLVLLPGIFMVLPIALGWNDKILLAMLVAFATPTAITSYPMAKAAGCDGPLASEIVAFTTGLSMFSIFLWIFCFKNFGLL